MNKRSMYAFCLAHFSRRHITLIARSIYMLISCCKCHFNLYCILIKPHTVNVTVSSPRLVLDVKLITDVIIPPIWKILHRRLYYILFVSHAKQSGACGRPLRAGRRKAACHRPSSRGDLELTDPCTTFVPELLFSSVIFWTRYIIAFEIRRKILT